MEANKFLAHIPMERDPVFARDIGAILIAVHIYRRRSDKTCPNAAKQVSRI